ncbi:glycosyltransferase [Candidatus Parcubacteria bacterium]|nr:glycosyltransferase [Candidatus Parcubacteria bacterium]
MISFIIPTLNEEKTIEKILSCISQYSGKKEVIISDGKSTDKTIELVSKYTGKIVVHDKPHRQTIGEARNDGALIATGDFLVFLDADTYIESVDNFFETLLKVFSENKEMVAATVSIKVLKEMETIGDRVVFACLGYLNYFLNNMIGSAGAAGEFQMIKRSAFEKIGGFSQEIVASEDYELFRRLHTVGRTRFVSKLRVYHTGRRAHAVGWPRLLLTWMINDLSVRFRKQSVTKEWTEVR